jgi:preprotein translocase subunit Sec63
MTDAQSRAFKFAYFLLGVVVPIAAYKFWPKSFRFGSKKAHADHARDITVEDSFPASDPPSAW